MQHLKDIEFLAYGAKFVTPFDPFQPYSYQGAFHITDCESCKIAGFTLTTDRAPNVLGKILSIDKEKLIADIRLIGGSRLSGGEKIVGFDSLDEDFTPNGHVYFADDGGYRWEMLNQDTMRLFAWPTTGVQLRNVSVGELLCMRHALYAATPLEFVSCRDIDVVDITVNASPGLSCAVLPNSRNFRFTRFRILPEHGSLIPYASNADGIHVTGLRGTLRLENCSFQNLGDDALNIHSQGATVYRVSGSVIQCYAKRFFSTPESEDGRLEPEWAVPGDVIRIYDGKTFKMKGQFTVKAYDVNKIVSETEVTDIAAGDFLANTAYFAKTTVQNCNIENTRARGLLIETADTVIENCKFYGTAAAAIIAAPDMTVWNEMAPIENLTIKGCAFENCGNSTVNEKCSGVLVTVNHNACGVKHYSPGIHGEVVLRDNLFLRLKNTAVFVQSTKKLNLLANSFQTVNAQTKAAEYYDCDEIDAAENEIF